MTVYNIQAIVFVVKQARFGDDFTHSDTDLMAVHTTRVHVYVRSVNGRQRTQWWRPGFILVVVWARQNNLARHASLLCQEFLPLPPLNNVRMMTV